MTVSSWKKAVSGSYSDLGKWTAGVPTTPTSEAELLAAGKPYTVTVDALFAVGELEMAANATLAIAPDSWFAIFAPASPGSGVLNLGAIDVGAASTLMVGSFAASSEIFNGGSINVAGAGSLFEIDDPLTELYGGGVLGLSDGASIVAYYNPGTLDNEDNKIVGSGAIGNGDILTLVNGQQGIVDANGAAALVLETGTNAIQNAGLIETTGAGGLLIESDLQQDGHLVAAGSGTLTIESAEVSGDGARRRDQRQERRLDRARRQRGDRRRDRHNRAGRRTDDRCGHNRRDERRQSRERRNHPGRR
jgi:hypothetical protein